MPLWSPLPNAHIREFVLCSHSGWILNKPLQSHGRVIRIFRIVLLSPRTQLAQVLFSSAPAILGLRLHAKEIWNPGTDPRVTGKSLNPHQQRHPNANTSAAKAQHRRLSYRGQWAGGELIFHSEISRAIKIAWRKQRWDCHTNQCETTENTPQEKNKEQYAFSWVFGKSDKCGIWTPAAGIQPAEEMKV